MDVARTSFQFRVACTNLIRSSSRKPPSTLPLCRGRIRSQFRKNARAYKNEDIIIIIVHRSSSIQRPREREKNSPIGGVIHSGACHLGDLSGRRRSPRWRTRTRNLIPSYGVSPTSASLITRNQPWYDKVKAQRWHDLQAQCRKMTRGMHRMLTVRISRAIPVRV
jgi:hypothetical protein